VARRATRGAPRAPYGYAGGGPPSPECDCHPPGVLSEPHPFGDVLGKLLPARAEGKGGGQGDEGVSFAQATPSGADPLCLQFRIASRPSPRPSPLHPCALFECFHDGSSLRTFFPIIFQISNATYKAALTSEAVRLLPSPTRLTICLRAFRQTTLAIIIADVSKRHNTCSASPADEVIKGARYSAPRRVASPWRPFLMRE